MPVTIKKKPKKPTAQKSTELKPTIVKEKAIKKAVHKSTGFSPKDPKALEESLHKYHSKTDEDLAKFIEPLPENVNKSNHRLDREQLEARLVFMHRMLIRKVAPEEIRKALNIGVTMYYKLKEELGVRMRLDVAKVDVPYLIGDTLAFYDEVRSMALTMSSSSNVKDPRVKLAAMTVALKAEENKNEFLESCGVYSVPVVEHIIRGMVSTGNFTVIDGKAERIVDAGEVNTELFLRLKQYAKDKADALNKEVFGDSGAINCNEGTKH